MSFKGYTYQVVMVRPAIFRMNEQTAVNNYFQKSGDHLSGLTAAAQQEFDVFVDKLREAGVEVIVHQDDSHADTPDAVFPNNWVSFHPKNKACLYPMFAPNRRQERTPFLFKTLESAEIPIDVIHDWSTFETQNQFLEGTGSLVLDRVHRIAYAAISNRTHPDLVQEFCSTMNYEPVVFSAFQSVDGKREAIYHTNVLMGLGPNFTVICLDTIDDAHERQRVENKLQTTGKEIIALSTEQMHQMAGNMICLHNQHEWLLVMSARAFRSLTPHQKKLLQNHAKLVYSDLDTIETLGGGSARCMIAEVF